MKTASQKEILDFIWKERTFNLILRNNISIYSKEIPENAGNDFWFEYESENINIIGQPFILQKRNYYEDNYFVFISDFNFKGNLCYIENNLTIRKNLDISGTIRVFKIEGRNICLSKSSNDIELWDINQKYINIYELICEEHFTEKELIQYDYGLYTKNWSKINLENKDKQVFVTSHYYYQELIECYERIKHLLSIVVLNSKYSNQYTFKETSVPSIYNTTKRFDKNDNFSLYDSNYLLYSELTIESLYKFWERVAFYIFQFIVPSSGKVNENNLSMIKLIKELKKELSGNNYLQNEHFQWFIDFVLSTNSKFQELVNFRHPLIHYKFDNRTKVGIGSLIANTLNEWSQISFDKEKLSILENYNKQILNFILEHFVLCKQGYDNMINLIQLLPENK